MEIIKTIPDVEMVSNLRSGRNIDETIKAIYRDHFQGLSWFVMNNSGNRQDAEDVFQEVVVNFIDMIQKDKFRGESSIKTLLFSMNRFIWLNELKKRGRTSERELKYEKEQDKNVKDVSSYIAERETKATILNLVESLGETCKKILLLFYYENLSMKEILENLDYENEQVVRNKKYKCLKQMEKMIAEDPILKHKLKNLLHE